MSTHDDHILMVRDCDQRQDKLTDLEITFIDSVSNQLEQGRPLTAEQSSKLDTIWERVT